MTYLSAKSDRDLLVKSEEKLLEHVSLNKRLSDENLELVRQLETQPTVYIPIIKEVEKVICSGDVTKSKIEALPSKQKSNNEVISETNTADIDDYLPPSLIRLLQ